VKSQISTTVNDYMVATGIPTGTITTTSSGECAGSGTPLEVYAAVRTRSPLCRASRPAVQHHAERRSTMRNE